MEGDAERREDGDQPEDQPEGLDEYRHELAAKYPGSEDSDPEKVHSGSGESFSNEADHSGVTPQESGSETEHMKEQVNPSSDSQESESHAEPKSGAGSDDERNTSEYSESNTESRGDLEQFRDDVNEKYPKADGREGDEPEESERESQGQESTGGDSNSHGESGSDKQEHGRTDEGGEEGKAAAAHQDGERNAEAENDGQPSFDGDGESAAISYTQPEISGSSVADDSEDKSCQIESTNHASDVHEGKQMREVDETSNLASLGTNEGAGNTHSEEPSRNPHEADFQLSPDGKGELSGSEPSAGARGDLHADAEKGGRSLETSSETGKSGTSGPEIAPDSKELGGTNLGSQASGTEINRSITTETEPSPGALPIAQPIEKQMSGNESASIPVTPNRISDSQGGGEVGKPTLALQENREQPKQYLATVESTAYLPNDRETIRFELWRSSIERQSGLAFEKEKLYQVTGNVDGKYGFVAEHKVGDNNTMSIHLSRQVTEDVTVGTKHAVNLESIVEKRQFEVTAHPEPVLTIQKRALESAGIAFDQSEHGKRVIEFEMLNLERKDHTPERYFGSYCPSQKSVRLYVGERDAKVGNRFELIRAGDHTFADFAKDFNSSKAKEFQNIRLDAKDGHVELRVDGKNFCPSESKLSTYHLQVGLSLRFVGAKDDVRLWSDGTGVRGVYGGRYRILGLHATEHNLWVVHDQKGSSETLKFLAPSQGPRATDPSELKEQMMRERLSVLAKRESFRNTYSVVAYRDRDWERRAVFIPKDALTARGIDPKEVSNSSQNVIEAKLRNLSQPNGSYDVYYGRVTPSKGHVVIPMMKRGWREDERFELVDLRRQTVSDFVSRFNTKSKESLNVTLTLEGKILGMDVSGARYDFEKFRLLPFDGELMLKASSRELTDELRFWFDGRDVRATFGNQYRILSFDSCDKGLMLNQSLDMNRTTTSYTGLRPDPKLIFNRLDSGQIAERLQLTAKPEGLAGQYCFEANLTLQDYVSQRLELFRGTSRYKSERGRLGEEIGVAVLSTARWEEVRRHPGSQSADSGVSQLPGPDSLILHKDSEERHFFEFKWVKNYEEGLRHGRRQLEGGYGKGWTTLRDEEGSSDAFVGLLQWYPGSSTGKLDVRKVKLQENDA
jgi:hypothetical protein